MTSAVSTSKKGGTLYRLGAVLLAVGMAAAATPALADGKHKNHWKHDNGHHYGQYKHPEVVRYYDEPDVIYVERPVHVREPVYVRERVYVQPRPVYVEPVYQRPSINIVVPLFD
ncbi:hypothetical protein [Dongia sp.]|uniref:hypothetical protein n=1 Tax=Dongia sp. TaxID=1977262 RepID=UPI0035AE0811